MAEAPKKPFNARSWPETIVMLVGAVVGGFVGGRLVTVLAPATVRGIVISAGMLMTLVMLNIIPVLYSFYGHREPPEGAGDMGHS